MEGYEYAVPLVCHFAFLLSLMDLIPFIDSSWVSIMDALLIGISITFAYLFYTQEKRYTNHNHNDKVSDSKAVFRLWEPSPISFFFMCFFSPLHCFILYLFCHSFLTWSEVIGIEIQCFSIAALIYSIKERFLSRETVLRQIDAAVREVEAKYDTEYYAKKEKGNYYSKWKPAEPVKSPQMNSPLIMDSDSQQDQFIQRVAAEQPDYMETDEENRSYISQSNRSYNVLYGSGNDVNDRRKEKKHHISSEIQQNRFIQGNNRVKEANHQPIYAQPTNEDEPDFAPPTTSINEIASNTHELQRTRIQTPSREEEKKKKYSSGKVFQQPGSVKKKRRKSTNMFQGVRVAEKSFSIPYVKGSTISSIVDQVVKKAKLEKTPSKVHVLTYKDVVLDNSFTLARANVPQSAILFLQIKNIKKGKKMKTTKVALQLPSNKRIFEHFPVHTTLWDILVVLESKIERNISSSPSQAYSFPIIMFMNRKFTTPEALQAHTISSLGAENALLRLSFGKETGETVEELGLYVETTGETTLPPVVTSELPEMKETNKKLPLIEKVAKMPEKKSKQNAITLEDRKIEYFPPPTKKIELPSTEDYSPSFYQLCPSDLAAGSQKALNDIPPFEREEYLAKQIAKHKTVTIKFCFPDRSIVKGIFNVKEKAQSLHNFLCSCLADSAPFQLFTTPPKEYLSLKESLFSQHLYPMAKVMVEWTEPGYKTPETLLKRSLPLWKEKEVVEVKEEEKEVEIEKTEPASTPVPDEGQEPKKEAPKKGKGPSWFLSGRK